MKNFPLLLNFVATLPCKTNTSVNKIGGEDWEGPPADGSEIVRWHYQLVGIR